MLLKKKRKINWKIKTEKLNRQKAFQAEPLKLVAKSNKKINFQSGFYYRVIGDSYLKHFETHRMQCQIKG